MRFWNDFIPLICKKIKSRSVINKAMRVGKIKDEDSLLKNQVKNTLKEVWMNQKEAAPWVKFSS